MLMPRRTKHRKMHRGHRRGKAYRGSTIAFGDFALQALEGGWVDNRQIEAARRAITHHIRRGGQMWIRIFPDKGLSKKPVEVRMGGGKGPPEQWVAIIKPGRILFELTGVPEDVAQEAMLRAAHKLSVKTRFISRDTPEII
ncbi:MAG: 50S ribosomal protein L16 [Chloroflexi bacterium]|nr:50S ribosomal protein L16 [Chloroflexota bacterium]